MKHAQAETSFHPQRIFLVGFMGSGKSYLGERLAERLNRRFLDIDRLIEKGENRSISKIFREQGEEHFRKLEAQYLRDLASKEKFLLATGGGTPCYHENMEWMNAHGVTIYLNTDPGLLYNRLRKEKAHRPLIAGMEEKALRTFIAAKLAERTPFYEKASVIVRQEQNDPHLLEELYQNFSTITGH